MGKLKGFKKLFGKTKGSGDMKVEGGGHVVFSSKKDEAMNLKRASSGSDSDYVSEQGTATPARDVASVEREQSPSADCDSLGTTDSGIRERQDTEQPKEANAQAQKVENSSRKEPNTTDDPALATEEARTEVVPRMSAGERGSQIMESATSVSLEASDSVNSSDTSESCKPPSEPSFVIGPATDVAALSQPKATSPKKVVTKDESEEAPWIIRRQTEYGSGPNENRCFTCSNVVYPQEKLGPIKKVIYHHWCLQCAVCYCQLSMKNFTTSNANLRDRQVYCRTHQPK